MKNIILISFFLLFTILDTAITAQNKSIKIDSVIFNSKSDTLKYGATITTPLKGKNHTAVIIISGTGKQDRDGTMGGYKFFAEVAEYLSNNGFVVLRMDDRGVGQTTGDYAKSTTYDFAIDAIEAVKFLKNYPGVNKSKIGLLGHSEGGAAISIAASMSKDIKFLISLSGLAMNGLDALITQNEALVNNSPQKDRDKIRSNEINGLMFKTIYQYADSSNLETKIYETYRNWRQRDSIFFESQEDKFDHFRFPIWRFPKEASTPWYRFFVRYNSELYLSEVHIPILAINGDRDNMVVPSNLYLWKKYAGKGHNKNVKTILMPGLNHLLQPVDIDKYKESEIKKGISKDVLNIISDWLRNSL